ncbi:hypothetical protein KL86CLO1_11003 [uncultured Eubacteriales bacterium]|uniref:Uncharacterized protein n=1 Tax=uncultured Eubacteriales bacterium TaxID=172733 RepID=A0A212JFA7_9FIRM|nr:hypothetical protein KL86CLO1_11003 [uncultured Eubacteriales bacterium]
MAETIPGASPGIVSASAAFLRGGQDLHLTTIRIKRILHEYMRDGLLLEVENDKENQQSGAPFSGAGTGALSLRRHARTQPEHLP